MNGRKDTKDSIARENENLRRRVEELEAELMDAKSRQARLETASRHTALLAEISDIVMEVDAGKVYTWANEAGRRFFGDDVVGREAAFYFEGEQNTYELVGPLFAGSEQTIYVESWQRRRDGEKRLLAWWCRVLKDRAGEVTGALSTARDITDERRKEREIARLTQVLEAIRNVNQLIAREHDPARLIAQACSALVQSGVFDRSWLFLVDERREITHVASTGFGGTADPKDLCGSGGVPGCLAALDHPGVLHGEALERVCERCPHAEAHRPATRMVARLSDEFPARGVLGACFADAQGATDELLSLLAELAGDLGLALGSIEEQTRRRAAEEALRASEERFRTLADMLPLVVFETDASGALTYVNHAAHAMFGYTHEEFARRQLAVDMIAAEDRGRAAATMQRILGGETSVGNEYRARRKDGGVFPVLIYSAPIVVGGRRQGLRGAIVDLTARCAVEQKLRESEGRYRSLVENSLEGIGISQGNRIVYANRALLDMFGYGTLEEFRSVPLLDRVHPDSRQEVRERMERKERGELGSQRFEHRILRKDGTPRELEVMTSDILLSGVRYTQSTFRDMTERKRAEEALRDSEERFRFIFDHAADVILLLEITPEGVPIIRDANTAALQILGYDREDLLGRPVAIIETVPAPSRIFAETRTQVLSGGRAVFEAQHRCKDGTLRDFACSVAELSLGSRTFSISVERDVTEAKKLQHEREAYQASLAQSDRLASMGMLAAGVAHEINNPLSYLIFNLESTCRDLPDLTECLRRRQARLEAKLGPGGFADVWGEEQSLCDTAVLQDVIERLGSALSGAQRIKNITRSLGTFSRVERTTLEPVNVQSCVEHAVTMCFNELKCRARFVKDFAQAPSVLASDGKLAQVFLNLLINAAHAIPEGHVKDNEVRVRVWPEKEFVIAEVSDTGGGIARENQARIFEPFFTTKGVGVGTGLGLSICKKIVEDFGGDISFTSQLGRGTSFRIRLPVIPSGWAQGKSEPAAPSPVKAPVRGRILVIDDEEGIRAAIVRILRGAHEVLTASSGKEGQALLEKDKRFDLVFCDLMMPTMSGMDLHAWLSKEDAKLAEQIVFITGGAFSPRAAEYLSKVGNLRIEKPFDMDVLERMTAELIIAARSKRGG